jgi:hypothetical protein
MYVAALAAIVGQVLLLGRLALLLYATAVWLVAATFVRFKDETYSHPPFRRGLRSLPMRGFRPLASPAPLEPGRKGQRTRR